MITKEETFKDVVRGGAKAQSFTIDTESSVIFEILRDKMYKDKIGAVAREVASNARDANREAKVDKPVEITVIKPNRLQGIGHESVSFKDYGAGMNPDKIVNIYLKYGASDKRTTNELTGGFGLGAKTPFAYNDTFTVITVANWAKPITEIQTKTIENEDGTTEEVEVEEIVGYKPVRRYRWKHTGMLDTSGKGKMVTFSEEETDDPTGTEVIVPIKTISDRIEFEKKILKYTKTWASEVNYINFNQTQQDLETVFEEDGFGLFYSDEYLYGDQLEMVIDGIPYPMDNSILQLTDTVGRSDSHFLTVLKFDTGELSISANRESVQYDEETIALIKERYAEFQDFMNEKLNMLVEGEKSYLEACIMTYNIRKASVKKGHVTPTTEVRAILAHADGSNVSLKNATWRGIPTIDKVLFKHHHVNYVTLENGKNNYNLQDSIELYSNIVNIPMVYGDVRKSASRNANFWEEGKRGFYLITPKDKDSKEGIEEFMNFIFKLDVDFKIYSDIEPVKAESGAKGVYVKKSYVNLNVRNLNYYSFRPDTLQVERKSFEGANGEDFSKYVFDKVSRLSRTDWDADTRKLKFLAERGYKAVVVREQDYENWFKNTDMIYYGDIYQKEYDAWKHELLTKKKGIALNQMILDIREEFISNNYVELIDANLPKIVQGRERNSSEELAYDELDIVKKELKFDFNGLRRKLKAIFATRYPLIKTIMNSYYLDDNKKQMELYIKQVNNYYGS